jgi:benzoate-CoA ligase family protein
MTSSLSLGVSETIHLADRLIFEHVRRGQGARIAVVYQNYRLRYDELASQVSQAASALRARGLSQGDRAVLLLSDSPAFVVAFFGALTAGIIPVPLNPNLNLEDVAYITEQTEASLVILEERSMAKFGALARAPSVRSVLTCGDCAGERAEFEQAIDNSEPFEQKPAHAENGVAYCLFSSGSTGPPKGIPRRHGDILHCAASYAEPVLKMTAQDVILSVPKLSFGYGLGGNILFGFLVGATSILFREPPNAVVIFELAEQFQPTLFLAQPRLLSDILHHDVTSPAISKIRLCVSAGEVLTSSLYQKWLDRYGVELLDGFGSTEMGHIFISNKIGDVRTGCAGRVLSGFEVKIVDDDGPVPANATGRLYARGQSAASWYWNDPERSQQTFRDGWVASSDLFRQDNDGYLYVIGREDDMIKVGCGQWVAPAEVEDILLALPAVADVAVVGTSDSDGIIHTKAFVVLADDVRPSLGLEEEAKAIVRERWPDLAHRHLSTVEFITELPRTPSGKLQRFRLQPASLTEFSYDC